jgi:predicted CoA-binding protein
MKNVTRFLALDKFAMAGVSRDPKKAGQVMFKSLREKGMDIVPVNPNTDSIGGVMCYHSVSDLPSDIRGIILMTPKEQTLAVAREAIKTGVRDIWIQQGADSKATVAELEKEEINLIHGECIMMFWKPSGMHSFHRFLKKIFRGLPA